MPRMAKLRIFHTRLDSLVNFVTKLLDKEECFARISLVIVTGGGVLDEVYILKKLVLTKFERAIRLN